MYRCQRCIHDYDIRFKRTCFNRDFVNLALADQRRGPCLRKRNDVARTNFQSDGGGEADRFGETRPGTAGPTRGGVPFGFDVQDKRTRPQARIANLALTILTQAVSRAAVSVSWS